MYCNRCNAYNDDNARFCNNCGAELVSPQPPEQNFETNIPPQGSPFENNVPPFDSNVPPQEPPFNGNVPPQGNPMGGFDNSPYGQPMYPRQRGIYSNVLPIISIVLNAVNFSVIGIIFAVLSLLNYNKHEDAMRRGDFMMADMLGRKSRNYSIAAIVINIVSLFLRIVIGFIAGFVFTDLFTEVFSDSLDGYYDGDIMSFAHMLIH